MPAKKDLHGMRFGRLTVIKEDDPIYYGRQCRARWLCKCDCGNFISVTSTRLLGGTTKSCGCLKKDAAQKRAKNLIGQKFGKLTVIDVANRDDNHRQMWLCKCECGNTTVAYGYNLKSGSTSSCGCVRKSVTSSLNVKHNGRHERLYSVWLGMRERCANPNHISYKSYGGRGISVCDAWNDFSNFKSWATLNGYNPNAKRGECTIDRINNDGNYSPENCRWVNMATQNANRSVKACSK